MAITQTITTIPTAGHRGVDARETFVTKQEAFQDALTDTTVTQLNNFATQANTLATEVNNKEVSAVTAKDNAVLAQVAAELARDEAVGAVSTLPDGIINDGTVSATDTWSSEKIDSTKANKTTPTLTGLREVSVAMAANDINLATGNLFTKTITGATTLTVSNIPTSGTAQSFILELTNGGSGTITWFSGAKFAKGTAPTLTANGKDIIGCYTLDGGTTWNVLILGLDVK